MNSARLAAMANRIGDFFIAFPAREQALQGIAGHIHQFWSAAMRAQFLAAFDAGELDALSEIVRDAVLAHRDSFAASRRRD
jgi:formate dehydrogenase subunit delta